MDGFLWLLLMLGPLLILQRSLHREIQSVFLLITRRPEIAIALFSLLFFPGVLLHESSHFLMAKLLNVPTGRVSSQVIEMPKGEEETLLTRFLIINEKPMASEEKPDEAWYKKWETWVITGAGVAIIAGVVAFGLFYEPNDSSQDWDYHRTLP